MEAYKEPDPRWVRLRALVRRVLLTGNVSLQDGGYDLPRAMTVHGLDSNARCELVSVLMALRLIRTEDRIAHQLLVREIGLPCNWRSHYPEQGHCHRIPRQDMPVVKGMEWGEVESRTEEAIAWLLSVAD